MYLPRFTALASLYQKNAKYTLLSKAIEQHGAEFKPQCEFGATAKVLPAAPTTTTIDIEPEQCVKRCLYILGKKIGCYEVCF